MHIYLYANQVETINTAVYVQIIQGWRHGTIGTGCTQGKEKWVVPCENTGNPQPQAEILLHGKGIVQRKLGEPHRKQESQVDRIDGSKVEGSDYFGTCSSVELYVLN